MGISVGGLVWIIIGVVVAANRNVLSNLDTVSNLVTAILTVLLWPLVLLGIDLAV